MIVFLMDTEFGCYTIFDCLFFVIELKDLIKTGPIFIITIYKITGVSKVIPIFLREQAWGSDRTTDSYVSKTSSKTKTQIGILSGLSLLFYSPWLNLVKTFQNKPIKTGNSSL